MQVFIFENLRPDLVLSGMLGGAYMHIKSRVSHGRLNVLGSDPLGTEAVPEYNCSGQPPNTHRTIAGPRRLHVPSAGIVIGG